MSQADLVADLKASLNDAQSAFTAAADADFVRHIATAALAFGSIRPRTLVASLSLVADQAEYAAPTAFLAFKSSLWGIAPRARAQPWETAWPGRLPDVRYVEQSDGTKKLYLDPPPTSAQISALGADFRYYYFAAHVVDASAANTTILAGERGLLLLRAQAESCRELAIRGSKKPVQLRDGLTGMSRNSTPAALYQALLQEFRGALAVAA